MTQKKGVKALDLSGLLRFIEEVPIYYRRGPWHPAAHLILLSVILWLLLTAGDAEAAYSIHHKVEGDVASWTRICVGCYMWLVTGFLFVAAGWLPLASYTVTSWNILATRLLCCGYASLTGNRNAIFIGSLLRFPSLVGACITVSVWWSLLVPTIYMLLRKHPERQRGFLRFNFSPLLLNLHLLNLPISVIDFFTVGVPFTFFDLWAGITVCTAYILFYLNVLDRAGIHFYIIFTPRSVAVVLTYPLVIALYYGVYSIANRHLA
jgi:hypothetical protein